jgi:hypothetical protein
MGTTGTRTGKEQTTILCCIPGMSVKRWLFIFALVLLFVALCVVVFADGPGQQSGYCDLQTGLPATLNLSRKQCRDMRQLTNRFFNDTAMARGKIMEKRLEIKMLSKSPNADPYAINKVERELNVLQRGFSRRAYQTEVDQRKLLTPEQIKKMKNMAKMDTIRENAGERPSRPGD